MNWIPFFRTLAVSSGSVARYSTSGGSVSMPYAAVTMLTDAGLNAEAYNYNMLPLPGGRGDLGHSELAGLHISEKS